MGLWIPERLGTPANGLPPSDRFVSTPKLIGSQLLQVESLLAAVDTFPDMTDAMRAINRARMPRKAGRVALSGDVGSFDLQAMSRNDEGVVILPQPKNALDEETKEPAESGAVIFSRISQGEKSAKLYGLAINPDEDPWLADALGINRSFCQNQFGIVIAPIDNLDATYVRLR